MALRLTITGCTIVMLLFASCKGEESPTYYFRAMLNPIYAQWFNDCIKPAQYAHYEKKIISDKARESSIKITLEHKITERGTYEDGAYKSFKNEQKTYYYSSNLYQYDFAIIIEATDDGTNYLKILPYSFDSYNTKGIPHCIINLTKGLSDSSCKLLYTNYYYNSGASEKNIYFQTTSVKQPNGKEYLNVIAVTFERNDNPDDDATEKLSTFKTIYISPECGVIRFEDAKNETWDITG